MINYLISRLVALHTVAFYGIVATGMLTFFFAIMTAVSLEDSEEQMRRCMLRNAKISLMVLLLLVALYAATPDRKEAEKVLMEVRQAESVSTPVE